MGWHAYGEQLVWLFVLPIAVACVSWTVTHEDVFREAREYCSERSKTCRTRVARKLFYLPTCEYCFSHYVTLAFLVLTGYRLLLDDWRGVLIAFFAVSGIANVYMSGYARVRVDLKSERLEVAAKERDIASPPADGPPANAS